MGTAPRRRSLVSLWLEESAHPVVALAFVLLLETAATIGLLDWAGWSVVLHAASKENAIWFAVCAGGQIAAYLGYTLALQAVAAVDGGVELNLPSSFAIVSIGFAPIFSANTSGGFSIDLVTLREAGLEREQAFVRVLALSALEYAVLAPAVAVCGVLLVLGIGGEASPDVAFPWLAVVPGALVAWLLTQPPRRDRLMRHSETDGRFRRGVAHTVAALTILRTLVCTWPRHGLAVLGSALYWAGDIATLWGACQVFRLDLSIPVLVLAYGTGWALTRRSLPLGGPGVVEVLLAWVLTWFHVRFGPAAAGVLAYRVFNFWLALLPAALVLPFADRLQKRLAKDAAV